MRICYLIPGCGISGGIAVILQHINRLRARGHDAFGLMTHGMLPPDYSWFPGLHAPIHTDLAMCAGAEAIVATGWQTVQFLDFPIFSSSRKFYFVQSDERRFDTQWQFKETVGLTYKTECEYFTVGWWMVNWLEEEFGHRALLVPNGLDEKIFYRVAPTELHRRPRVLLEGPLCVPWKGVYNAFTAVAGLGCEIYLVSAGGTLPDDMVGRIDRFFDKVPMDKMREIYSECDVLLKMSKVEGVPGPPLEAMACGCAVVISDVTGASQYINHGYNALVVPRGDTVAAMRAVEWLLDDGGMRANLCLGGYRTANNARWDISIDMLEAMFTGAGSRPKNKEAI